MVTSSIANFITDRKLKTLKKHQKFLIGMDYVSNSLKKIRAKYQIKVLASYGMSETSFIASEKKDEELYWKCWFHFK